MILCQSLHTIMIVVTSNAFLSYNSTKQYSLLCILYCINHLCCITFYSSEESDSQYIKLFRMLLTLKSYYKINEANINQNENAQYNCSPSC